MIFLTIGTSFPFNRLIQATDFAVGEKLVEEKIFAQVGESTYLPNNFEFVRWLEPGAFDKYFREASGVISDAGIEIISTALDNHKPLLTMPRLKKCGEVINDHQVALARKFEELGHILVAYREEQLPQKIRELKSFVPRTRHVQTKAVADRIQRFLDSLQNQSGTD
jgi:UDP-N-acetylglucosamine transferase subunit ALG13